VATEELGAEGGWNPRPAPCHVENVFISKRKEKTTESIGTKIPPLPLKKTQRELYHSFKVEERKYNYTSTTTKVDHKTLSGISHNT
jgi:hypothetical protein